MVTGSQVKQAMYNADINIVDHHRCAICDEMTYYFTRGDDIYFNAACGCARSAPQKREWDDLANWINIQTNDDARLSIAKRVGLELKD